jgi:peroxiredoxin
LPSTPSSGRRQGLVGAAIVSAIVVGVVSYVAGTRDAATPEPALLEGSPAIEESAAAGVAEAGDRAPEFTATTLDGSTVSLADLRGQPVIINFWASWCFPCREEFPMLRDVHEEGRIAVVGVIFNDISSDAEAFAHEMAARWPQLIDEGGRIARAYGVRSIPRTFFLDNRGIIQAGVYGFTEQSFRRHVERLE